MLFQARGYSHSVGKDGGVLLVQPDVVVSNNSDAVNMDKKGRFELACFQLSLQQLHPIL
jgi:hypothetical protein